MHPAQDACYQNAITYGGSCKPDPKMGLLYCSHGTGLIVYPGTDLYTKNLRNNYGVGGPIASVRLKEWRRGIQDVDYLGFAQAISLGVCSRADDVSRRFRERRELVCRSGPLGGGSSQAGSHHREPLRDVALRIAGKRQPARLVKIKILARPFAARACMQIAGVGMTAPQHVDGCGLSCW